MSKLALLGGEKSRKTSFPPHPLIGSEEKKAALAVLESGRLSTFIAASGAGFLGGEKVKEFEKLVADYHDVKFAVAFNSATAALHAAVVACGVQPGEEVITTPYTFTSTATCALMANAVPVFADVDKDCNLDPNSVRKKISPLTKAIIPVHLFGFPAEMDEIMKIAKQHNLKVIEDCAQAPAAKYKNKLVGTIGDCGILSFTENKHITSGEGGMLITNTEEIAHIARLIRNHGEAVIAGQPRSYKSSILGWNYRLTEMDAAIGIEQFKKLDKFNDERIKLSDYLRAKINDISGLKVLQDNPEHKHVYYVLPIEYDEDIVGIPRGVFVQALVAEGIPCGAGYVKPLYYSPIYHENKPFIYKHYKGNADYSPNSCPIAENFHFNKLIITLLSRPPATFNDMDDIVNAIKKIIDNKKELEGYGKMYKTVKIGNKIVGEGNPCFVIAEAGANWRICDDMDKNFQQALKLIDIAVEAKADIVKFQVYKAKKLYVKDAGHADYIDKQKSIFDIIKEMELPYEWLPKLKKYCDETGIMFFACPFDNESADALEKAGVDAYKIASYSITDFPFLKHIARKGKPIIMSTGASDLEDVKNAVAYLKQCGNDQIILLQCTAKYPAPIPTVNLKVISSLKNTFDCPVGLSDHSREPLIAPLGAIALGANVVEKHYTTDNALPGPDHGFAVLGDEFISMVNSIRQMEAALGSGKKDVDESEKELHSFARHFIYSIKSIKKGELFTEENIDTLRPGKKEHGLTPDYYDRLLGKKARMDISEQTPIKLDLVEDFEV